MGVDTALRRRLADARVADRFSAVRARSVTAVSAVGRVRTARLGERTVGAVRRRLEAKAAPIEPGPSPAEPVMPAAERALEAPLPPPVAPEPTAREPVEPEPPAPEPPELDVPATAPLPPPITARSAGARRSIPRRE
jgi:hypothetical protein